MIVSYLILGTLLEGMNKVVGQTINHHKTINMKYKLWEVGGRVRDRILGLDSKDIDYAVEIFGQDNAEELFSMTNRDIYDAFVQQLKDEGYTIWLETPDMYTIRAKFPKGHPHEGIDADFVICRKEVYLNNKSRKPTTTFGTIIDDLERRDFTVNAIAESVDGTILDPFNGRQDLNDGVLKCVGSAARSFHDDPLRIFRAMRFCITKDLTPDDAMFMAMKSMAFKLEKVSVERFCNEVNKCFTHCPMRTMQWLYHLKVHNYKLYEYFISKCNIKLTKSS